MSNYLIVFVFDQKAIIISPENEVTYETTREN